MIETDFVVVVIASRGELYDKFINNYWSKMINYVKTKNYNITFFLIFGNDSETSCLNLTEDNKIILNTSETLIPGILNKTIDSFKIINNKYKYKHILRTNLSSFFIIDNLIKTSDELNDTCVYAGVNGLHNGIPFVSGAAMWFSHDVVKYIIDNEQSLHRNLLDDVAIGVLLINHKRTNLTRFTLNHDVEAVDKEHLLNHIIINNHYHIRIKSYKPCNDISYMNKFTDILYTIPIEDV